MMEDADLNWAHLFGEATVLLRENRRQGASSETAITLPDSGEMFRLPSNLYIVATCEPAVMEDTILGAIQQDFFIRPVNPEPEVLRNIRVQGISLEKLMTTLNLRISYFLGADYQLGEGFFLASPEKDPMISLGRVFREQIIPVLEKWFDGDIEKIRYVLGDNGKTDEKTVFYREMPFTPKLFKGNIPDYFDTESMIYQINEKAFFIPRSYIEIYQ
jgi:5-methylcytosine-specific restriction endonuclease McrBC GTP-binding regulatory subunit McrB